MMPLTMAKIGEENVVKQITGKDETKRHLENLGFVKGAQVTVVSELAGNMIINVKGVRVALDRKMSGRILI